MDKAKLEAKIAALKKTSNELKEGTRKGLGEELAKKKVSKVTVIAPDEKGLAKGLSKAEELLKAKFGEKGLSEKDMEESDEGEELEHECPMCSDEGCEECSEMDEE